MCTNITETLTAEYIYIYIYKRESINKGVFHTSERYYKPKKKNTSRIY